jgi:hypothetical protein
MRNIEIMLHDGMIGQKSVLLALSSLTTGNLNSKLKDTATPYKMETVLPLVHDYIVPPPTEEEMKSQVNANLTSYIAMHPNAPAKFKNGR